MASKLLSPFVFQGAKLANRVVLAPMTRGRAGSERIPNALMAEYYSQRSSGNLLVTEATGISQQGNGWVDAPGIYSDAMVEGWKHVTEAVHKKQSKIFLQLWHMGRVSHSSFNNGKLPVAPSAIAAVGDTHTPVGKKDYEVPRALETAEIPGIVEDYARAASRALAAGFDGVEIHGANGYLIDQFLQSTSNQRTESRKW
jgi:N-ethylmaleimide reductase